MKTADEYADTASVAELAWVNLSETFKRACSMYHKGKEADAMRLAREELPNLIGQWSGASELDGSARRLRLMSMFVEEGRKVGEITLAKKMFSAYLSSQALMNRKTKEILQHGGLLTGSIRLTEEPLAIAKNGMRTAEAFDRDSTALQMIR